MFKSQELIAIILILNWNRVADQLIGERYKYLYNQILWCVFWISYYTYTFVFVAFYWHCFWFFFRTLVCMSSESQSHGKKKTVMPNNSNNTNNKSNKKTVNHVNWQFGVYVYLPAQWKSGFDGNFFMLIDHGDDFFFFLCTCACVFGVLLSPWFEHTHSVCVKKK